MASARSLASVWSDAWAITMRLVGSYTHCARLRSPDDVLKLVPAELNVVVSVLPDGQAKKQDGDQDGEQMQDPGAKEDFHSTQVQSVQRDSGGTLTVFGLGVSNGVPVSFLIVEQAATSTTLAFYGIELSDGYALAGNLLTGSIQLQ